MNKLTELSELKATREDFKHYKISLLPDLDFKLGHYSAKKTMRMALQALCRDRRNAGISKVEKVFQEVVIASFDFVIKKVAKEAEAEAKDCLRILEGAKDE